MSKSSVSNLNVAFQTPKESLWALYNLLHVLFWVALIQQNNPNFIKQVNSKRLAKRGEFLIKLENHK